MVAHIRRGRRSRDRYRLGNFVLRTQIALIDTITRRGRERHAPEIVVCVDIDLAAELIDAAQAVLRPRRIGDRLLGDVAAVLVTDAGHRFRGVSIDTASGTGFCAEHSAIAAMVTAGEYRIVAIVAVWRDEQSRLYVLPPCGRCREFMRQVDPANLDATVVLGGRRSALVRELLPEHDWPEPEH